jgi:DNA-binding NtrC family response regulator
MDAFTRAPGRFIAVVCDQSMPGLRGDEVISRMRALRPRVPIVLTSGYHDVSDMPADIITLPKPYKIERLVQAVARAIAR